MAHLNWMSPAIASVVISLAGCETQTTTEPQPEPAFKVDATLPLGLANACIKNGQCKGAEEWLSKRNADLETACVATSDLDAKKPLVDELLAIQAQVDWLGLDEPVVPLSSTCGGLLSVDSYIDVTPGEAEVEIGTTLPLSATIYCPAPATCTGQLAWWTENPDVLDVDQSGNVEVKGNGTAWVYVTSVSIPTISGAAKISSSGCDLTLTFATLGLAGWPEGRRFRRGERRAAMTLEPGWGVSLEAGAVDFSVDPPRDPTPKCLSDDWVWTTDNESVATVGSNGVVTAVSNGDTRVYATNAQHPAISTFKVVHVVDHWTDQDGDLVREPEFQKGGYGCYVGSNAPEPSLCEPEVDIGCPAQTVYPGDGYQCYATGNPYLDPREDCEVRRSSDPEACVRTTVEVRDLWVPWDQPNRWYFQHGVIFRDESAMQSWWLNW